MIDNNEEKKQDNEEKNKKEEAPLIQIEQPKIIPQIPLEDLTFMNEGRQTPMGESKRLKGDNE